MKNEDFERVVKKALVIKRQLLYTAGVNVIGSWGVKKYQAAYMPIQCMGERIENAPTLLLQVNARLFKGTVAVSLNEGADTYQINLFEDGYPSEGAKEIHLCEECYCDNFADIIDRAIERGDNEKEYEQFCRQQILNI